MNDPTLQATALPRLNEPAPDIDPLTTHGPKARKNYTDCCFCKKGVAA